MATMMRSTAAPRVASRRTAVVAQASMDRRSLFAGLAAATVLLVPKADALVIPSHASTGGMLAGGGSVTKSSTAASAEGYTLEGYPGTKKPSFIEPAKKKKLLAKARAEAEKIAK